MKPEEAYKPLSLKNINKRPYLCLYIALVLTAIFTSWVAHRAGLRFNSTPSVERGLWKLQPHAELQIGNYVTVSPAGNPGRELGIERGYIDDKSIMLKKIVALEGDFVDYDTQERTVTVNGGYVHMTEILPQDSAGRSLQGAAFPIELQKGQVWLSSEYLLGYDSRYFGPVSSDALTKAIPVWTFR